MCWFDFSIEKKADVDPMLTHGRKVASDLPIALSDRNRSVLIFRGRRARGFDESSLRSGTLWRSETRGGKRHRNREKRTCHGFVPASSVCPYSLRNCFIKSGVRP